MSTTKGNQTLSMLQQPTLKTASIHRQLIQYESVLQIGSYSISLVYRRENEIWMRIQGYFVEKLKFANHVRRQKHCSLTNLVGLHQTPCSHDIRQAGCLSLSAYLSVYKTTSYNSTDGFLIRQLYSFGELVRLCRKRCYRVQLIITAIPAWSSLSSRSSRVTVTCRRIAISVQCCWLNNEG